ncbi:MAG: hypothetical protein ACI4S0_01575 [Dorea sp.]
MMKTNRKYFVIITLLIVVVVIWAVYVISFNKRIKALDEVPIENYSIGEYVAFDENYSYGYNRQGFEMKVDSYKIKNTTDFLAEYGKTMSDFDQDFITDKICMVDITVRYNGTEENAGFEPLSFFMCGKDYYDGQNDELYVLANPKAEGATGIMFHPGDECTITLVFNLRKIAYTNYNWEHIEDLERMIYLTSMPVQKNIVLHE